MQESLKAILSRLGSSERKFNELSKSELKSLEASVQFQRLSITSLHKSK